MKRYKVMGKYIMEMDIEKKILRFYCTTCSGWSRDIDGRACKGCNGKGAWTYEMGERSMEEKCK